MLKEVIIPDQSNKFLFLLAPIITFTLALIGWAVVPFSKTFSVANINVGVLYLLATSSLGVYGIIIAGWASNSKYAFLGAIRSSAQMISYEVSIGLIIISVVLCVGSLNLTDIILAQKNHCVKVETCHIWKITVPT
jgi:NADH-quinone oxidoreductase subunit H